MNNVTLCFECITTLMMKLDWKGTFISKVIKNIVGIISCLLTKTNKF